jgi:cobalt-zinc-cadmium efflux system membrane fusion protein
MNGKYIAPGILIAWLALASCSSQKGTPVEEETQTSKEITISRTQFETAGMQLGRPEMVRFQSSVRANGQVSAAPSGMAQISSLVPGKIKRIAVNVGDRVNKGQLLCVLESTEYIQLQQDYAESHGRLKSVQAEYERQKGLAGDNIASQKNYLNAEGEYLSLQARCEGLKTKLQLLGMNADKAEKGLIVKELSLTAPIGGYVSSLLTETGSFAEPQRVIMELLDLNQLQLKLSVFEKDFSGLKPGLKINFFSPNNPAKIYTGSLLSYSRTIDAQTKAITVIGSIVPADKSELINGMYLEAEILTGEKEAMALPDEAILKSGDARLVLVQKTAKDNEMTFVRKEVKTGLSSKGFTEILNPEGLENVLVKGGFNLVME